MKRFLKLISILIILICLTIIISIFYTRFVYGALNKNVVSTFTNKVQVENAYSEDLRDALSKSVKTTYDLGNIAEDMVITESNINSGIGILELPRYNIKVGITEGVDMKQLKYSVGHFPETPFVGEGGNCAICGHSSSIYDCVLDDLHIAEIGDEVKITVNNKVFTYYITEFKIVSPTDMYILANTVKEQLTLVTCINGGTERLVVIAEPLTKVQLNSLKNRYSESLKSNVFNYGTNSRIINSIYPYIRDKGFLVPLSYSAEVYRFTRQYNGSNRYRRIIKVREYDLSHFKGFTESLSTAHSNPEELQFDKSMVKVLLDNLVKNRATTKTILGSYNRTTEDNLRIIDSFNKTDYILREGMIYEN